MFENIYSALRQQINTIKYIVLTADDCTGKKLTNVSLYNRKHSPFRKKQAPFNRFSQIRDYRCIISS